MLRHTWGLPVSTREAIVTAAGEGYAGIEGPAPTEDFDAISAALAEHDLQWICLMGTQGATVVDHVNSFREKTTAAAKLGARAIVSHSRADSFDAHEAISFFREVQAIERDLPVQVAHETPTPPTRTILEKFALLKRCCDFSNELDAHERWWDKIWHAQSSAGRGTLTMTPEFGPPMYLHTIPHENAPVADLALVVRWMASRLRQRYQPT
ncbi:MAG TPA: hypothetical protein VGR35_13125 [Tepidisphaeraceae bacterium]|nr:hypothetical protein [Tepidisphaeraceae bacterium]